jgi:hypothetical protein
MCIALTFLARAAMTDLLFATSSEQIPEQFVVQKEGHRAETAEPNPLRGTDQ